MEDFNGLMKFYGINGEPVCKILEKLAEERTLRKNQRLGGSDSESKYVYFLISGVLRSYVVNENGEDITNYFICRYGQPYIINFRQEQYRVLAKSTEALCPAKVICFPRNDLMETIHSSLRLMNIYCENLTQLYNMDSAYINMLLHTSAQERYEWFLIAYPGLIDVIPHKYIASFLNVTPVTLSRVRRALREGAPQA